MAKKWTKAPSGGQNLHFSQFFLKQRPLVAKKWTKAPSGGHKLHFLAIFHDFFLKKRHLVAKNCIFCDFSRFFCDFLRFFKKKAGKTWIFSKKKKKRPPGGEKMN